MLGADSFEVGQVIGSFIDGLDERTTSVRIRHPQANALAAFAEINRAIGFDPKDLTLSDLQNVLTLYLEYQCNHHHRTVLCVEKADQQSMWLLDCISRLAKSTESSQIGRSLLVILSGAERLTDVLRNTAFDAIRKEADRPIRLGPLSIFETRELLCRMCANLGYGDIQNLIEFDAVERLHNLSGGIPHVIAKLFRECVAIVTKNGVPSATCEIVSAAASNLRADSILDAKIASPKPVLVPSVAESRRRLLIHCPDKPPQELALTSGRFLIGRSIAADIVLSSPTVSRRHALLINTGETIRVRDLGSVNGVYAGTERIAEVTVEPGTVLRLGNCELEYKVD
jgi:type II secretory pathway predicted ATPase ExeA